MTREVWKYLVPIQPKKFTALVLCPAGSKALSVLAQGGDFAVYMLVNTKADKAVNRVLLATVAGQPFDDSGYSYINSIERWDGDNVCWWHMFMLDERPSDSLDG